MIDSEPNVTDHGVLAIDIGAGTQDIVVYQPGRPIENSEKLVLPSQTQVVARRINAVTASGRPLHLSGRLMGGGASTDAIVRHIAAGFRVTANTDAARTIHNRPERIAEIGVVISDTVPDGAAVVELGDLDLPALRQALDVFGVSWPGSIAVALQDHGFKPGASNNDVRFDYLQSLLNRGGELSTMVFRRAPEGMTRIAALLDMVPDAYVMDTGAAAVLGAIGDPHVAAQINDRGAVIVNLGNMHSFAALVKHQRLFGLFEHHTGGMTAPLLHELVTSLQNGSLDAEQFAQRFDGHGAAYDRSYTTEGPFPFVAITGPNRGIARQLGYYEAAPFGDMMLTGSFGLVEAVLRSRQPNGWAIPGTLLGR